MQYSVSVRTLCEFTAKRGDLDLRFTPSPTAQEGIAGHQWVAASRGADYEKEISLRGEFGLLVVRGRADGYDPAKRQLEEIKTRRGRLDVQPANHRALHWAQAKIYGWLFCLSRGLDEINLALVYFDIGTQKETTLVETHTAASLRNFFEERCAEFLAWAQQELAHRAERDQALQALAFPHDAFRKGQRALAEAAYRGTIAGRCVLAQAPTGIGKTIATVFGLLKGMPARQLDKVFYLTAKSTGRQMALEATTLLRERGPTPSLRVVELTARDKMCEHPDKACHGESCPLARGFYDRLPAARADGLTVGQLDLAAVRDVARRHAVCPYYLSQELAKWSDVAVGDFNYWFDGSGMLYGMTVGAEWRVGVLADEAHNLVERARSMYSATLSQAALHDARAVAIGNVRKAFDKVHRGWSGVRKAHEQAGGKLQALPASFGAALKAVVQTVEEHLAQGSGAPDSAVLQQAYFGVLGFMRLFESFGPHSVFEVAHDARPGRSAHTAIRIQNLIPAPFLKPRFAAAQTATLFSATLSPPRYPMDMLGMPADTVWIDVESPFRAEQLRVNVVSSISTRYADRQRSAAPIAAVVAKQYAAQRGNYLAFFSSFEYLKMVASEFRLAHPDIPTWSQARAMTEVERSAFLERFQAGGAGVGFAVLGGSFGEGIDLRGDRLVGAFVATLGLPQINARNEELRSRLDAEFGAGYDYTYLYPGLQKVVQAAGRVIRTQKDQGVVYLIDDRYAKPAVQSLLPAWWQLRHHARDGTLPVNAAGNPARGGLRPGAL